MSEGIEKYRNLTSDGEETDILSFFDDEEGAREKELTPEHVAQVWGRLSDMEKKFVTTTEEQFDAIMPEYEKKYGEKKAGVITALRKLVLSHDPRVGLIGK